MARSDNKILALLGFNCTGDLGPWTLYTSKRHQLVFYPRMPALNPPSSLQLLQRTAWSTAAEAWSARAKMNRDKWEAAAKRASLKITGYNLWLYWRTSHDMAAITTIERQTGIQLLP